MSEVITEYSEFLESTPAHWITVKMQDVGRIISGGTPSRDVPSLWNGGIPWVTPGELTSLPTKEIHQTAETISPAGLSASGANLLPAGSLLITSRATLGARAVNSVPMATNQGFKSLVPFSRQLTGFVYHLVDKFKPEMVRRASGTTFLEISGSEFADIDLPMPPSDEAIKIAEILDTLDAAIGGTEAVVAKLKAMKQGLLHDLLTRGIDANGDLRPPQPEAPHLYKRTLLGWLPKEWSQPALEDITATSICYGIVQVFGFVDDGVPVLAIRDLLGDYQTGIHRTARQIDAQYPRSRVKPGDVLLSIKGTIGRIGVVPEHFTGNISRDIGLLRPNHLVKSSYLSLLLRSNLGQQLLSDTQVGTTRAELSIAPLKRLRIPLPPLEEQISIAKRVDSLDGRLREETAIVSKLRLQKLGLMDDLLTGRRPVTALL
jgi:type I restriction enzyme S subunit